MGGERRLVHDESRMTGNERRRRAGPAAPFVDAASMAMMRCDVSQATVSRSAK